MDRRFSALWLRSKFSICSYQLLSGTIPLWEHRYYSDFGTWRSARGLLHLCRGSGRYCSTSGFGPLKNDLFPLQFAFNFWSSFLKEDFPFRPSGNRGSGSFVSYPQSSMLCSGNPGVLGVQRTPGEVAEARQPMYPSLPPEEQRPET